MYYTIVGAVTYTSDEAWKPEALVDRQVATVVSMDYETAVEAGDALVASLPDADSYLIPQGFNGRIYNNTDKDLIISDGITIPPMQKREWQEDK